MITKSNKVEVSVKVLSFSEEAAHDDFSDGTSLSYRLAVLVVIGPKKYEGLKLNVAHYGDTWIDSVLAEVGRELNIEISEVLLSDSRVLIVSSDVEIVSVDRVGDEVR